MKPIFLDNRDGNTLARAITKQLAALRREGQSPTELCVATYYPNPQGLELLKRDAPALPTVGSTRFPATGVGAYA